ncbi:MAG: twin-arginine translocation signal domain-containing protein, partial [Pyrinomonadaceae bacterium]
MSESNPLNRREFVKAAGGAVAASLLSASPLTACSNSARRRYAVVGTGERSVGMWGHDLTSRYSDVIEFVALCDTNPKRVAVAK